MEDTIQSFNSHDYHQSKKLKDAKEADDETLKGLQSSESVSSASPSSNDTKVCVSYDALFAAVSVVAVLFGCGVMRR